ncbi:MAG: cbb3-type cytochrome c oxidase subunit 3 [Bacteroidetes bacterium]|nr:cbb3-type cytochrome c oxidase subunit 3 [Bacteroidota bacterium]MCH8523310.1 cbb3-type cytochrome c oxidase subunit 3 [Balneolales bacterium]
MRRDVIETIQGVEIFPLISLVIFVVFFIGLMYYVIKMKRSEVEEYSNMPLEEDEPHNQLFNNDSKPKGD